MNISYRRTPVPMPAATTSYVVEVDGHPTCVVTAFDTGFGRIWQATHPQYELQFEDTRKGAAEKMLWIMGVRCPECGSVLINRRCPRCDRQAAL